MSTTTKPVSQELHERDRVAVARRQVGHDDVGRGADDGQVAAEAGAERQRPPQRLASSPASASTLDDRDGGRRVRDVVDDRGRRTRRTTGCRSSRPRGVRRTTSARASATPPTMPTWTTASTSMNRPTKKNSVFHSMSRKDSCGSSGPTIIRTVAPSRAMVAASRPIAEWTRKPTMRQTEHDEGPDHQRSVRDRGRRVDRGQHVEPVRRRRPSNDRSQTRRSAGRPTMITRTTGRQVDQEVAEVEAGGRADEDVRRDRR